MDQSISLLYFDIFHRCCQCQDLLDFATPQVNLLLLRLIFSSFLLIIIENFSKKDIYLSGFWGFGVLGYVGGTLGYVGGTLGYVGDNLGYVGGTLGYVGGTLGYVEGTLGYVGGTLRYVDGTLGYVVGTLVYVGGMSGVLWGLMMLLMTDYVTQPPARARIWRA